MYFSCCVAETIVMMNARLVVVVLWTIGFSHGDVSAVFWNFLPEAPLPFTCKQDITPVPYDINRVSSIVVLYPAMDITFSIHGQYDVPLVSLHFQHRNIEYYIIFKFL